MKRFFYSALYELKYAWNGIRKHLVLTFSCIMAMVVSLVLIASFLLIGLHIDRFANGIQGDMSIHVVLTEAIDTQEEIDKARDQIEGVSNVDDLQFSSKEDELEMMIEEKGEAFSQYRGEENPLSNAFFVSVKDSQKLEKTAEDLEALDCVSSVAYGGESATGLVDLLDRVRKVGYVLAALLLILSMYLIYNTIRTTIYSRKQEIAIMRQVGGTNTFVRTPFVLQGMFIGLLGAMVPLLILVFGYPKFYDAMDGVLFASVFDLLDSNYVSLIVGGTVVGCGLIIGILASVLAVRKALKANR